MNEAREVGQVLQDMVMLLEMQQKFVEYKRTIKEMDVLRQENTKQKRRQR